MEYVDRLSTKDIVNKSLKRRMMKERRPMHLKYIRKSSESSQDRNRTISMDSANYSASENSVSRLEQQ